jgi:hypothetical protein
MGFSFMLFCTFLLCSLGMCYRIGCAVFIEG